MDSNKINITASIVLYKNPENEILNLINTLKKSIVSKIFIIDNSPNRFTNFNENNIIYFHFPNNPGFGNSHNFALKNAIDLNSQFHFIINPDIIFSENVIKIMVDYALSDKNIGMMMPKILNLDGSIQYLPKLLPSPFSILYRKFKFPKFYYKDFIMKYEFRFTDDKLIYNAPIISGCFTLLNLKAIREVGVYDDKYFMYFEDWDLSRRMHKKYKTLYFPKVTVYHGYESGANKNGKLFKIFIKSAITYFNKWGWFFDSDRRRVNRAALEQFNK